MHASGLVGYLWLKIAEISGIGKLAIFGNFCNFTRLNPCTWYAGSFQAKRVETPTNTSEAKRKKYKYPMPKKNARQ